MNKKIALKLKAKADEIAEKFSHVDRSRNYNKESFRVHSIIPASEKTAFVLFRKYKKESDSGKIGMAFLYYIKGVEDGYWQYFFPTESHIHGMQKITKILQIVEEHNYPINLS
jgi:hypothetical protein